MGDRHHTTLLVALPCALLAGVVTGACSGGSETGDYTGGTIVESQPTRQPSVAERQAGACQRISAGIVRCDDPAADPTEQAQQQQELTAQCQSAPMSPQLVVAYEGCARGPQTCGPLLSCLDQARKDEVLRKLRARQNAACHRISKTVTRCAESTMPAEEIAKRGQVNDAQRERHGEKYREECEASEMSQRQISVFESCLQVTVCDSFLKCIDQAQPRR